MPLIEQPFINLVHHGIARPYLRVRVQNPFTGIAMTVLGLIDTGADECGFPARYAEILGHTLEKGIIKQINTGNGVTVAYAHTVHIEVNGLIIENVMLDFKPNLSTPLLGVRNFLSHFVLVLNYPKQYFSLSNSVEKPAQK
jgi:predicted aspartyl protease